MSKQKTNKQNSKRIEELMKKRIVNLSSLKLTTSSETSLLQKGLNFCPTPPPPNMDEIDKDINDFARRLNLKEYHAPKNPEDIDKTPYYPTTSEKLNRKMR